MDDTFLIAGFIAYLSLICFLRFPGGLANIGKTDGFLIFIIGDLMALCISVAVLIVGIFVEPGTWNRVKERAKKGVFFATISVAIAVHQVAIMGVGNNNFWLRFFVTGLCIVVVCLVCLLIRIVREEEEQDRFVMGQMAMAFQETIKRDG